VLRHWIASDIHEYADAAHPFSLLRLRTKRPCGGRTANKPDELTALHVLPQSSGDGILTPQTSALIGAEIGIKTIAAVHSQCR
jgi:hypothetical protein